MSKNIQRALLSTTLMLPVAAAAEISINGFASVGGGIFFEDEDRSFNGVDDKYTADPYIKFALQAKANINEKTDFTGQLIARGTDDYKVDAEWAYVTYHATDSTDIRVGRLRSPFFLYSDFLDVGIAYPWIAPPVEVYRFPFTTVEGVDIVNQHSVGDWDGSFQAYFGRLTDETTLGGEDTELDLENFMGLNYSLSNDWLTLRASYNRADFSIATPSVLDPLINGARAAGASFASLIELADALEVTDEEAQFYGVGINIDYEDWLVASEYTVLDVADQSAISDDEAWYVMLGRRFGSITLNVTYVNQESDADQSILDLIPNVDIDSINTLRAGTQAAILDSEDTNIILGLRYDYAASTAFKFEINQVEHDLDNELDGTLVSFSIDTVF